MKVWHIGNTTVRTPYRLKAALAALKNSEFLGNLVGQEREHGFAKLLNEKGIVNAPRLNSPSSRKADDLGRKWRSALGQLGFVVMHLTTGLKHPLDPKLEPITKYFPELTGRPYEITPNGYRLIEAQSVAQQQECFLKALAAYRIPSAFESKYKGFSSFSPLIFVIDIIRLLEDFNEDPIIKFHEMALIVQCRTRDDIIDNIVKDLINFRNELKTTQRKPRFYQEYYNQEQNTGRQIVSFGTLKDYADVNFRYLKATGLFCTKSRGITLIKEKKEFIDSLLDQQYMPKDEHEYIIKIWNGAELPTDDKQKAVAIIIDLKKNLKSAGEELTLPGLEDSNEATLTRIRHQLEERLQSKREHNYAFGQAHLWEEIVNNLKQFETNSRMSLKNQGELIKPSPDEKPAYFEWIIWRAFLAINSLSNTPWDARRFQVDQDFLPVSHAPSGGPDMIFEFEDFVLVVEVTLSTSSRQEAVEGEPVRRHVADIATKDNNSKRVFCLFIAREINSNTAETFKIGNWYKKDDTKVQLNIVPMALRDFILLFQKSFESGIILAKEINHLLMFCRANAHMEAPAWKKEISNEIKNFVNKKS